MVMWKRKIKKKVGRNLGGPHLSDSQDNLKHDEKLMKINVTKQ